MGLRELLGWFYQRPKARAALRRVLPSKHRPKLQEWLNPGCNGVHWCRVVMNREIEHFIRGLDCPAIDALEISGTGSQDRYNFRSYRSVAFPDFDICKGPLEKEGFDLVIAEQVFEHVVRPDLAAASVLQMLRPNGRFVISTPFLLKVHGAPGDLYRWTETGMRQLLETAGFIVTSTGSWGNRPCLLADMTPGLQWTFYRPGVHSLQNEPQFPVVVWAFAAKPMES